MEQHRVSEILQEAGKAKIAVYGDFCLDAYWIMDPRQSEVSVETGLQAEAVDKHYYTPGGAANVVANVSALKPAQIKVIGVVGDDIYGRELTSQLIQLGADTSSLVVQKEHFDTYTYLKKYNEDVEDPRVDFGVYNQRSIETDQKILSSIREALQNYDVLIFNQQVQGSITNESFIDQANEILEEHDDKIVILDSRHFNNRFRNVYRKANDHEIAALRGIQTDPKEDVPTKRIIDLALEIYKESGKPVFATCGPRGIIAVDGEGAHEIPGIQLTSKLDTVGAGDTVISALAVCLASGVAPEEAAWVANFAAGVTVQKLYTTGTATGEEIRAISTDPDLVFQADLAENPRSATYLEGTEIEIADAAVLHGLGQIKHAVFDHDGTISTLREGWEEIMEPVMIKAVLGDQYEVVDQQSYNNVVRRIRDFIDKTTGIQTIFQMEGLIGLVKEFGYVAEEKILDKFQYKDIYNEALMEMVNKRMAKLKAGELDVQDFTLKSVLHFLEGLKEKGVTMYLASGTDVDDVKNEAEVLGYASLFDGGIYGAMRDVSKFSKKMVLEKIINEHQLQGNELVVFGDGPVEMRECRRCGGTAVGITSNEIRRYGIDIEKRSRVVKAGAQILVSDFSQYDRLLQLLSKGD